MDLIMYILVSKLRTVQVTTHIRAAQKLKMYESTPPLPHWFRDVMFSYAQGLYLECDTLCKHR
jgi:hypothetical protein